MTNRLGWRLTTVIGDHPFHNHDYRVDHDHADADDDEDDADN